MTTYICKGKGTVSGANNGGAGSDAFNGLKALSNAINANTVKGGDTVRFEGAFGLAEMADFPCPRLVSEKLQANTAAHGGPYLGTSQAAGSSASGIRFEWTGPNGQSVWDMTGADTTTERMTAAIRIQGEDITLVNPSIRPGDWNYIFGSGGAARIAGGSDAEQVSDENYGIILLGNGNGIDGGTIDATGSSSRFCRFGIFKAPSAAGVSGASSNKTGYVRNVVIKGCASGGQVQPFGASGYALKPGTRETVSGLTISDASWGWQSGYLSSSGGNAAKHGNGWGVLGAFLGGFELYGCDISGHFQDGIAIGVAAGAIVRDCYIHDISGPNQQWWVWNAGTAKWDLATVTNNVEGNGVKTGLANKDGTSPSTWLGTDGVAPSPGDNPGYPELRNQVIRCRIYRVNGAGITSNQSRGNHYHANEIDQTGNAGILLVTLGSVGNQWISNNFVRRVGVPNSSSSYCLRIESNNRVWLYNNILWSDPGVSGRYDLYQGSGAAHVGARNVLVTGRQAGSPAWDTTNDLPTQTPAWTQGVGLAAGSPLIGAGTTDAFLSRSTGAGRNRLKALFASPPNVGPY